MPIEPVPRQAPGISDLVQEDTPPDQSPQPSRGGASRWAWVIPVLLVVAGAALRVYRIHDESAWMDELASFKHLHEPTLFSFIRAERGSDSPMVPAYFASAYVWSRVFGAELVTMRLYSVALSIAAMALLYRLARDMYGRWAGAIALFCFAASPIHVYFAQEVRMYEFTLLAAVASAMGLRQALNRDSRWGWALLTLSSVVLMWTHLFANFLLVVHGTLLLACCRYRSKGFLTWLTACALSGAGLLIWLKTANTGVLSQATVWMPRPTLRTCREFLMHSWGLPVGSWPQYPAYDRLGLLVILLAGALFLGWSAFTQKGPIGNAESQRRDYLFLVLWWLAPPVLLGVFSEFVRPAFVPRYIQYNTLAAFILLGGTVAALRVRAVQAGATVALVLLYGSMALINTKSLPMRGDWQSAARAVLAAEHSEDPVCCVRACNVTRRAIDYYLGRQGLATEVLKDADQIWAAVSDRLSHGQGAWVVFGENKEDYVHQKRFSALVEQYRPPHTVEQFPSARGIIWVYHLAGVT